MVFFRDVASCLLVQHAENPSHRVQHTAYCLHCRLQRRVVALTSMPPLPCSCLNHGGDHITPPITPPITPSITHAAQHAAPPLPECSSCTAQVPGARAPFAAAAALNRPLPCAEPCTLEPGTLEPRPPVAAYPHREHTLRPLRPRGNEVIKMGGQVHA